MQAFFQNLDQTHTTTLVVGLACLAVLFLLPLFSKRVPSVLVAVIGATIVSALFGLAEQGVDTVGALPQGVPKPSFPWTSWSDVGPLLIAAVGIVLVSLTDTIATSTSFAAKRGDEVDPDQEMIGIGAANISAAFFQGFAISTSGSRTAVAEQSGAKSQVTGLVGAGLVAAMLLFFPALLADLPQTTLAAVVIFAAVSLMDLAILGRYYRVRKSALMLSLVATVGVILFGVLGGIVVAVILAVLMFFRRNWWPHGAVLGQVDGLPGWHDMDKYPDAGQLPGIVVYRWEAPLFFANAGMFRERIRRLARERKPSWIVLQCEAITDIDVTAAAMLEQLDNELNAAGVHLAFAELRDRLKDRVLDYGLFATLDRDHFYLTLKAAVREVEALGPQPPAPEAAGGHKHKRRKKGKRRRDEGPVE